MPTSHCAVAPLVPHTQSSSAAHARASTGAAQSSATARCDVHASATPNANRPLHARQRKTRTVRRLYTALAAYHFVATATIAGPPNAVPDEHRQSPNTREKRPAQVETLENRGRVGLRTKGDFV